MSKVIPSSSAGCDEHDPTLLSTDQALARALDLATPITESLSLGLHDALGKILADAIISPINVPGYANSAMDGYAVQAADLPQQDSATLKLIGTAFAGNPYQGKVNRGECVRIMTGAKLPEGADSVIMQEHVTRGENETVLIGPGHHEGQNVRYPGEDIAQGSAVLRAGQYIGPAELGLLASLGIARVNVLRPLRVAFFSTGDELRPVGSTLEEGQIYDSNRYTLHGMLTEAGMDILDMGVIRDDPQAIEAAFAEAAAKADAVITSGGVSVGEADFVKATLDKLGQVDFWRIAMKPGKPLAMGRINKALFFGLPGNPVSVMATFYLFALPALRKLRGETDVHNLRFKAVTQHTLKKRPGRTDFQRGVLSHNDGRLCVDAAGMQASHILSGMSRANCFIVLGQDEADVPAGSEVEVIPFHGLMP